MKLRPLEIEYTVREAPENRDITCRSVGLQVRAQTVNESERSVEAVLATENRVAVFDMRSFEIIDEILLMRGVEIPPQMPLLDNHNRYALDDVLGSIRTMRVEGGQLIGRVFVAEGSEDSPEQRAWRKVAGGHITDVSVGYKSRNYVDIPPGETQTVEGRDYTAGVRTLRVTTDWLPREGSLTPIGADAAAKIRQDAGQQTRKESEPMNKKLRQYLESIGLRSEATEAEAWTYYKALEGDQKIRAEGIKAGNIVPADNPPAGDPPQLPATAERSAPPAATAPTGEQIAAAAVAAERTRVNLVRSIAPAGVSDELIERAVAEGWDETTASRHYLEDIRQRREQPIEGAPFAHTHNLDVGQQARAVAAGLMHRVSRNVIGAEFGGRRTAIMTEQDADQGDRYRTLSMVDLCRQALVIDGRQVPHDTDEMIRTAVSSSSLSNIFSTSVHASLLSAYSEAADTSDWCSEEDVANYQTNDRASLGKTGALEKLGAGGTAKHADLSDEVESYKVARYAKQFVIDEIDIRNDNLDGFQRIPMQLGDAAARLRPDLVYSILLANAAMDADGVALFHADHNNTDTNAFAADKLGTGITAMYQQTRDGVRLDIRPQFLIVNPTLEWTARETLQAGSKDIAASANVLASLGLQIRVEGRVDATGVTDPDSGTALTGSATTWFLAAPMGRTIVVGYLAGTGRRPMLRSFTLDRGQWGIGFDVAHSIGVKALDFRGLYRGNT